MNQLSQGKCRKRLSKSLCLNCAFFEHEPHSECRIAVLKEIAKMKERAKNEPTIPITTLYSDGFNHLTKSLKFKIADVNAPLFGGLLTFNRFRGTLTTIRAQVVTELPQRLSDIGIKKYTLTNEGGLFLRFDNKSPSHRILIFMSDCGIEWLRESWRNHGDGTFRSAPVFFFNFM